MALLLHYTGQDYISRGLLNTQLTPGSTSAIVGGCKTGKGFAFDGTVDSVLSTSTIIDDSINQSFSFWFSFTGTVTQQTILSVQGSTTGVNNTRLLIRRTDTNGLGVGQRVVPSQTYRQTNAPITFDANTWHHATFILKELERKIDIYINAVYLFTHSWTGTLSTSNQRFVLGKRALDNNAEFFNGQICNFKYYNHVLSAREIAEDYKSLMLHYKLDKPITTQVFDHSGFQRHIAVIENTTTNSTTEKRVYGGSLANDGTKSLYGSLNLSELNGINEISVAVRFRFVSKDTGNHGYFSSRTAIAGGNGIGLFKVAGTSRDFYIDIAGRNTFTLPYDLVTGSWYDLVAVKSTTDVKLYINGALINTISNTNSISNIGQLYASISRSIADDTVTLSNPMNGNIQDIRFYAKALTQAEVTELYQTRHMVDKSSNCYTYELIEGQTTVGMNKQGQLLCDEVIENDNGTFQIVSNKKIKTKEIKEI
jgi:hypothetical protein